MSCPGQLKIGINIGIEIKIEIGIMIYFFRFSNQASDVVLFFICIKVSFFFVFLLMIITCTVQMLHALILLQQKEFNYFNFFRVNLRKVDTLNFLRGTVVGIVMILFLYFLGGTIRGRFGYFHLFSSFTLFSF